MRRNTVIASVTLTAGLAAGGLAGALLGVPGVSGAQTPTTEAPTQAPAQQDPDAQPPGRGRGGPGCHKGPRLQAAATALNMSLDDLRAQLREGKTIADVARAKGVDPQRVIDAMVADATQHIDQAVRDGKLTAEQAAQRKEGLQERITRMVNEGPPRRGDRPPAGTPTQ